MKHEHTCKKCGSPIDCNSDCALPHDMKWVCRNCARLPTETGPDYNEAETPTTPLELEGF